MTRKLILSLLTKERQESIWRGEDADFALETSDGNRQRVNVFCQQGRLAAAIRLLNAKVPTLSQLHLPPVLQNLANEPRGLILVTGPTGSGKSTTLAAMVDYINHTRADHILTIEDPIEYVYIRSSYKSHRNFSFVRKAVFGIKTSELSAIGISYGLNIHRAKILSRIILYAVGQKQ